MNYSRRPDERRRRVMMTAGAATSTAVTASSRRRMEQLREAQRPLVAYGSQVRRCLRGRWFSLVPVQRSAFVKLLSAVALLVIVLVFLHDASVRYVTIADQPSWVDVLRINRYGSFGRFTVSILYLLVAGAAWLIYQLRRYRNDDFSGNYQLWQWIVAVALASSVASAVPVMAMVGAGIDWALGQRAALSGKDWIELFLMVGGAILALRTVAEMWRYRWSTGFMVGGWLAMAIPTAADWNIIDVETLSRWTVVTSAPLIAVAFWLAATVGYLRCLFREVRGIESAPGLIQRLRVVADDWKSGVDGASDDNLGEPRSRPMPAPTKRTVPDKTASPAEPKVPAAKETLVPKKQGTEGDARRGWWPFGRGKASDEGEITHTTEAVASTKDESRASDTDEIDAPAERKKRTWWPSLKRKPKASVDGETAAKDDSSTSEPASPTQLESDDQENEPAVKKRRFGLGSIMKRRAEPTADDSDDANRENESAPAATRTNESNAPDDDGDADQSDDDIDWASMNKAERRRMRKQLKRGGKAA